MSGSTSPLVDAPSSESTPPVWLTLAVLVYLFTPVLTFAVGWLWRPWALLVLSAGSYVLLSLRTDLRNSVSCVECPRPFLINTTLLAIALGWAAFSGASHFLHADHDWVVRDAVIGDLIRSPWPIIYETPTGSVVLRSALGMFLPAALLGKLLGPEAVAVGSYLWIGLGIALFLRLLPLPQVSLSVTFAIGTITILFSGMDLPGTLLVNQQWPIFPLRLEWWVPLSYPSLTGQLVWAPNHALPAWLLTALIWRHRTTALFPGIAFVGVTYSLICTPFAALGTLPLTLAFLPRWWRTYGTAHGRRNLELILVTSFIALPVLCYIGIDLGGSGSVSLHAPVSADSGSAVETSAVVRSMAAGHTSALGYAVFIICEFATLFALLAASPRLPQGMRPALFASGLSLIALPALNFGPSNDALIRLCIPSLIVLLITVQHVLLSTSWRHWQRRDWVTLLVLLAGSPTALFELWRTASFPASPPAYSKTLLQTQSGVLPGHYVGRLAPWHAYLLSLPAATQEENVR